MAAQRARYARQGPARSARSKLVEKSRVPDALEDLPSATNLEIAVRVYPDEPRARADARKAVRPKTFLVFDTETTVDAAQRLTFGSYRFYDVDRCLEEGIFYADDLTVRERQTLERYVAQNAADVDAPSLRALTLYNRDEFVDRVFYRAAFKARSMVVCFNWPFDVSRIAFDCGQARFRKRQSAGKFFDYAGGFSFALWRYFKDGAWRENRKYRPRIRIKSIDSKRALKAFTRPEELDEEDTIPEWTTEGEPEEEYMFRGHFLDLRTLAFALTDRGYTLEQACEAFGVEHGKSKSAKHGEITNDYIDYNRRDVLATSELLFKVLEEFDRHPIDLQPTRAYSPASIGKAYLRAMGIRPVLQRQPKFSRPALGHAMVSFFGGRAECHIRRVPVPVVYVDFLSMYPTVNALMGLWRFTTSAQIKVEPATREVQRFLDNLSVEQMFRPATWESLVGLAEIEPDADVLPIRAKYDHVTKSWQIGINELMSGARDDRLWFSIADLAASKLLTEKASHIRRAIRFVPVGTQSELQSIKIRGRVTIDPRRQDFFTATIEQRKEIEHAGDMDAAERDRLDLFLKILANATSYGITAEIIRHELPGKRKETTRVYSLSDKPFTTAVRAVEEPGEFCFPPMAACITGAARLQLALLEKCVTDLGGTYAMCDTDSMTIVSTEGGGLIPCPGGEHRTPFGDPGVKALSWNEVETIRQRFARLNPYNRRSISGSVLELEPENFNAETGRRRQLWCFAISAKRYALFEETKAGAPHLLSWSEHGLGHLLNPTNPDSDERDWIRQAWEQFIGERKRSPTQPLSWLNRPAVGRITISSPLTYRAFKSMNSPSQPYAEWVKPFNFILSAHVAPFGFPPGADPERFHIVAPYNSDPRQWKKLRWVDIYSRRPYQVNTSTTSAGAGYVRVKTYGEVLEDYKYHPEAKSLGVDGTPCDRQDVGLLRRRPVKPIWIRLIGKEANEIEAVQAGTVHDVEQVLSEYVDPSRSHWLEVILPILREIPLKELMEASRMSATALKAIRRRVNPIVPHRANMVNLTRVALSWRPKL